MKNPRQGHGELQPDTMKEGCPLYYDPNKTLSRNKLFNFVVGARGCGKTYGAKKTAIQNWIKRKQQFVYIRRYETEMPAAEMANFFDDIACEFPELKFSCNKGLMRCNNEIIGWYIALSKATMLKSTPFPNVSLIIFDEFIIDTGVYRYLPKEVHTFLECYSTISRDRDIPVLFLSNAITFTNPYFLYFGLSLQEGQSVKLLRDISLELVQNEDYIEHAKSTRFGKLVEGTAYGEYAISNHFLRDTETFVGKISEPTYYICTIKLPAQDVGVHQGQDTGMYYASDKVDATNNVKIALSIDDHEPGVVYARRGGFILKTVVEAYCQGNLRFESIKIKNQLTDIFRRMI